MKPDYKLCKDCDRPKLTACFNVDHHTKDGLTSRCKTHLRQRKREQRARDKGYRGLNSL